MANIEQITDALEEVNRLYMLLAEPEATQITLDNMASAVNVLEQAIQAKVG